MNIDNIQITLPQTQIEPFYHDHFVESQVEDFIKLTNTDFDPASGIVLDVGGGCGFFSKALQDRVAFKVRVLDTDKRSIAECRQAGLKCSYGDALNPVAMGDEGLICFNLILHHLVGKT